MHKFLKGPWRDVERRKAWLAEHGGDNTAALRVNPVKDHSGEQPNSLAFLFNVDFPVRQIDWPRVGERYPKVIQVSRFNKPKTKRNPAD